jgi:hypothetical protein
LASTTYWDGDGDADSDGEADTAGDAESDGDADSDADGSAELDAGTDGSGTGVGSGMKRDGMPRTDRTTMRTKMPITVRIHGRANRSFRAGSDPRYPGSPLGRWLVISVDGSPGV